MTAWLAPPAQARARCLFFESSSRSILLLEHDLFRKPAPTFRDHAIGPLSLLAQQAPALSVPGSLLFSFALVVQLLAARQSELDFRPPLVVEVKLERHDGHAVALDRADQLVDLPLVQQQLARPLGRV